MKLPEDKDLTSLPADVTNAEALELTGKPRYTRKITVPIYEPTGAMPKISELYDVRKYNELKEEIDKTKLPDDLREFLIAAAQRHIAFNFTEIAEFYSHLPVEVKKLFENSGLVIIDYDDAIRNGFFQYDQEVQDDLQEIIERENW